MKTIDFKFKEFSISEPICLSLESFDFARKYYGYPKDFHGYVHLSLGKLSWIEKPDDMKWRIIAVNESIETILQKVRSYSSK